MQIEETDLTGITRDPQEAITEVYIHEDRYARPQLWLKFGQAQLRNEESFCWLSAYMMSGVTDWEHDSAYALRLPLIGVQFESVYYHKTKITAWVDPSNPDEFHVPTPGYDPTMLDEASLCSECDEPHMMVPPGYYVPPFDKKLYEKVKGKRLTIYIGPNWKKE